MRECSHGTPVGTHCVFCRGPVKPRRIELDYNHYMNVPRGCPCETCQRIRRMNEASEPKHREDL
jgi:hypothetical protein